MTIGALSRKTGVPVKTLREYEDMGLIYTLGRSPGNYRLFGDEALWCVAMMQALRSLGLTLAEIQQLAGGYLRRSGEPIGPVLASVLAAARIRLQARIDEARETLQRIDAFEANHGEALAGGIGFELLDPRAQR